MKYGELEQVNGRWHLRFERRLGHPPERVWQALTDEEDLAAWFPTTVEGDLKADAPLRFAFRGEEIAPFEGRMLTVEQNRLLEFEWGADRLRLTLEPDDGGTRLTLIDVLDDRGKGARDATGWHVCLENLETRLAGGEPAGPETWKPLNDEYVSRFGPEAATIGPPEGMA